MRCKALTLLQGSHKSNPRCTGEKERRKDYWLASPIYLSLCYVTCNLCKEFPCYTVNKVILQCFKEIMGGKQPEAKNMLIRVYNRNVNQIICRKRRGEGNDLIPCLTVWCLVARSKKILVRAEQTNIHCYSYSFQRRTVLHLKFL